MARVLVEKFIAGRPEMHFSFPSQLLGWATVVLPRSALVSLAGRGIDVSALLRARKRGVRYSSAIDVLEKVYRLGLSGHGFATQAASRMA